MSIEISWQYNETNKQKQKTSETSVRFYSFTSLCTQKSKGL